jgi:hypothetical protein
VLVFAERAGGYLSIKDDIKQGPFSSTAPRLQKSYTKNIIATAISQA